MRIAIVGSSGSGKTTLARAVHERTGISHVEMDALHHLAGWQPNPSFRDELSAALDQPTWVCDGNYSIAEDDVRSAADTIVVFDLPRRSVMRQLLARTMRRGITRHELWNGNREKLTNIFRRDPRRNILLWSWKHHEGYRARYAAAARSGGWDHADVVWIGSHADADTWLTTLPTRTEGD